MRPFDKWHASGRGPTLNPLRVLFDTRVGALRYSLRAWLIAIAPALAFFLLRVAFGVASLVPPEGMPQAAAAIYSVVVAPLVETTLLFGLAYALAVAAPAYEGLRIALLAALGALAHLPGGNAWQALNAFWPFLVYSIALNEWRKRSAREAFVVTALVHALYNATFFGVSVMAVLAASANHRA